MSPRVRSILKWALLIAAAFGSGLLLAEPFNLHWWRLG